MDLQKDFLNMQIAYEKNCAIRCNCSYEELKAQLDRSESLFGTRYLEGSPRHENWLLWVEAWQAAKAKAVSEGFVLVPKEPHADLVNHGHQVFLGHFNEGGQTGGRSLYFAYKAMIEAQEQTND